MAMQSPELLDEVLVEMEWADVIRSLLGPDVTPDRLRQVVEDGVAVGALNQHEAEWTLSRYAGKNSRFELELGGEPLAGESIPAVIAALAREDGWPAAVAAALGETE